MPRRTDSTDVSVECVIQDRVGFVWAGTDDGLFRFDGSRFLKFGQRRACRGLRIYQLHETVDGRLYVATGAGLARYGNERFEVIEEKEGLGAFPIGHQGVASDAPGRCSSGPIGACTSDAAIVFSLDEEANSAGQRSGRRGPRRLRGRVYFARGRAPLPQGIRPDGRVRTAAGAAGRGDHRRGASGPRQGRLWVRTVKRLYRAPAGRTAFERGRPGPSGVERVRRLAFDDRGRVLVPTVQGLAFRDGGRWRLIGRREGLPSDTALAAIVDREGSLVDRDARGRPRPASGARRVHELEHERWSVARSRLGDHPAEGAARARGRSGSAPSRDSIASIRKPERCGTISSPTAWRATPSTRVAAARTAASGPDRGPEESRGSRRTAGRGVYGAEDAPADQFRVASIRVRPDGEVWVGAVNGLYRLAAGAAGDRFQRVSLGKEKPDRVRGLRGRPGSGILYAASKQGILRLTGPSPRKFTGRTACARTSCRPSRSPPTAASSSRIASRSGRQGDPAGRPADGSADRHFDGPRLEQGRAGRPGRFGRHLDRHGLGGRRVRPRAGRWPPVTARRTA